MEVKNDGGGKRGVVVWGFIFQFLTPIVGGPFLMDGRRPHHLNLNHQIAIIQHALL